MPDSLIFSEVAPGCMTSEEGNESKATPSTVKLRSSTLSSTGSGFDTSNSTEEASPRTQSVD